MVNTYSEPTREELAKTISEIKEFDSAFRVLPLAEQERIIKEKHRKFWEDKQAEEREELEEDHKFREWERSQLPANARQAVEKEIMAAVDKKLPLLTLLQARIKLGVGRQRAEEAVYLIGEKRRELVEQLRAACETHEVFAKKLAISRLWFEAEVKEVLQNLPEYHAAWQAYREAVNKVLALIPKEPFIVNYGRVSLSLGERLPEALRMG